MPRQYTARHPCSGSKQRRPCQHQGGRIEFFEGHPSQPFGKPSLTIPMAPLPSASVEQARRLVRQATLRRSADAWRKVASTLTRDDLARPAPPESNGCRRHRARLNTRLDRAWSGRRCYDDGPGRPGGYRRRGEPSREWRAARGGAAIFWLAVDLELNQSTPRHFTGIEQPRRPHRRQCHYCRGSCVF